MRDLANGRFRAFWLAAFLALSLGGCALERAAVSQRVAPTAAPSATLAPTFTPQPTSPPTAAPTAPPTPTALPATGVIQEGRFRSATLEADVRYVVYLPPGYTQTDLRYSVFYLLHGKGGGMNEWLHVKADLDRLIVAGKMPPVIAVLPDAPFSHRSSYYVDSSYAGNDAIPRGEKVETALTRDLIAHVDATYRTIAARDARVIGGLSMGGWGALRFALAHPDRYRAAIILSPAVYIPTPPAESGMRALGAFGKGAVLFDEATYIEQNYPALLEQVFRPARLPLALFIAAGDDEHHYARPEDQEHDMDLEAHRLYNTVIRVPNMAAELRILQGGHSWEVWRPAFIEGATYVAQFIQAPIRQ
jgi:enterochelin esterase-like enzyme